MFTLVARAIVGGFSDGVCLRDPRRQVFIPVLRDPRATVAERTACMEVLLASLSHDPALFRTHVLKQ